MDQNDQILKFDSPESIFFFQLIAHWKRSYHVTLEDLKYSVLVIWSVLKLKPIKPTVSYLICKYLRPSKLSTSETYTTKTACLLFSVRKISLVYITSHQNFIVLFANKNISNCTKLHIFAHFGTVNGIEVFSFFLLE